MSKRVEGLGAPSVSSGAQGTALCFPSLLFGPTASFRRMLEGRIGFGVAWRVHSDRCTPGEP